MEAFYYLAYLIPLLFLVGAEAYWKYLIQKEEQNVRVPNRGFSEEDDK